MIALEDLTAEELQYMRSKWETEKTDLEKERDRKADRLNDRLNRQTEDLSEKNIASNKLEHAQEVLEELVANGTEQDMLDQQQAVIDELQLKLN